MNPEYNPKGSDITLSIGGVDIGKVQGIDFSTTRERQPVFTLGSDVPKSFALGKEGIDIVHDDELPAGVRINEVYGSGILNGKAIGMLKPVQKTEYRNVLILPIDGMTKADMFEFMPRPEDVFQLERLVKLNPNVFPYNKGTAKVTAWNVLDEGIVGTVVILSVE